MRQRLIPLLLSLVVFALSPAWAPASFDARSSTRVERGPLVGSIVAQQRPRAATVATEPLADYALYLPTNAAAGQPLQILVALHGMGGNGPDFARQVLPTTERYGWAVLAPTIRYRDYRDPTQVRQDGEIHPKLKALIEALPARTGLSFQPKVLFFGFSRGSQESQRFALMFPESTLAVAGMSAGSYTLPSTTYRRNGAVQLQTLAYPFGTADVEQICGRSFNAEAAQHVRFWIGVGDRDNRAEDVPRQWDPYMGTTRVERAQRIVSALQQFGAAAELHLYPGASHEITEQMREDALRFLASVG